MQIYLGFSHSIISYVICSLCVNKVTSMSNRLALGLWRFPTAEFVNFVALLGYTLDVVISNYRKRDTNVSSNKKNL
jgi:hypothetical protein